MIVRGTAAGSELRKEHAGGESRELQAFTAQVRLIRVSHGRGKGCQHRTFCAIWLAQRKESLETQDALE